MHLKQLFFLGSLTLASPSPTIDLGYAKYRGAVDPHTNITSFLGVRYAAAPTGAARFRAPRPPETARGVQDATKQPAQCWQVDTVGTLTTNPLRGVPMARAEQQHVIRQREVSNVSSEDCLFLSVYYPGRDTPPRAGPLPVVVWIHGGGYYLGSSSQFRGSDLIKAAGEDIVVVIIQYRLALFGFLAGREVGAGGDLNAGLLDQQFALRWVQKHISKFGGDPARVTIFGESAGGGSVVQHIVADGGNTSPPLFNAAISSSPFMISQYRYNERVPQSVYNAVVARTGCAMAKDSLGCLRELPAEALQEANVYLSANTFLGTYAFTPVTGGSLIRENPMAALKNGRINGRSTLVLANSHEGRIFVNTSLPVARSVSAYALELYPNLPGEYIPQMEEVYRDVGSTADKIIALYGDTVFDCPAYALLNAVSQAANTKNATSAAYKAALAIPPANHGGDLQYYFPSLAIDVPVLAYPEFFADARFVHALAGALLAFAARGDPNDVTDTIAPRWAPWGAGRTEMVFNRDGGKPDVRPGRTDGRVLERCRFWDGIGEFIGH
ncbi:Carboxylic ester hydrolase [Mycena indigotica]|uniref:Carboxylic ester hydrolase n=1 Tax=Mycena indigotica TaxID=2126181 RepID=A0A8H6WBL2_9AGAR|nr:Carboxylic ester hydrolase [Mycena indigotica]KAF7311927.1 Carboxylic ester hydrolase [Mycena indigotica]